MRSRASSFNSQYPLLSLRSPSNFLRLLPRLLVTSIYSTNIVTRYFKHGIYSPFFFSSSKCSLLHNSNVFVSCIIHILYTECAKIKKKNNNSGAKSLILFVKYTVYLRPKRLRIQSTVESALLQLIDVSENQVTEVQKLAFKDLYLVRINLSHNAIERIESGAFENCANVTLLDISHNKIDSIPRTAFDSNTYATELDLSYNLLTDLSQVFNLSFAQVLVVS